MDPAAFDGVLCKGITSGAHIHSTLFQRTSWESRRDQFRGLGKDKSHG
ncbi:hypothetical protein C5167_014911 [Papaver somniferum]|uniref:Uncharacterized protein n=1 Tax=Papaver somniferum TaxID=3469 RepID=A0A4Y7J5E7_PAPSO|nr:hypothetical protein C5167_014911 [Papaver somniferum]